MTDSPQMIEYVVHGPYHYEHDIHPCYRIDGPNGIVAAVFAPGGDLDEAEETARRMAEALGTVRVEPADY